MKRKVEQDSTQPLANESMPAMAQLSNAAGAWSAFMAAANERAEPGREDWLRGEDVLELLCDLVDRGKLTPSQGQEVVMALTASDCVGNESDKSIQNPAAELLAEITKSPRRPKGRSK